MEARAESRLAPKQVADVLTATLKDLSSTSELYAWVIVSALQTQERRTVKVFTSQTNVFDLRNVLLFANKNRCFCFKQNKRQMLQIGTENAENKTNLEVLREQWPKL